MRPRLGQVAFINTLPVYAGLDPEAADIVRGVPTNINGLLRRGLLDAACVSSIEYARRQEDYVLLPDVSISSFGPVGSVGLFTREPLEAVLYGKVALPTSSATSVALAQILLRMLWHADPNLITVEPDLDTMLKEADIALLIGDAALKARAARPDLLYYDLGLAWAQLTGERMVFAVFAARRQFVEEHPEEASRLCQALVEAKEWGRQNGAAIEEMACRATQLPPSLVRDYYQRQQYDFDASYQRGLLRFFEFAAAFNFCQPVSRLEIWSPQAAPQTP